MEDYPNALCLRMYQPSILEPTYNGMSAVSCIVNPALSVDCYPVHMANQAPKVPSLGKSDY